MQRHYFSRNLISAQISAAETWSRCWGVGAKIVITQSEGKTGKGRKQEWEATILGSQQIRAGCWEIPKTFFSSARYPNFFPKALCQTSDLFFFQAYFLARWGQLIPSTRSKQPNQRSGQKSGSSCYGLSYHQIIKCSDYQKRLQSGSGCYGFSDYHHLDWVSPIHHTAGTTLTPGFSMQHIFFVQSCRLFSSPKWNQVWVMRLS